MVMVCTTGAEKVKDKYNALLSPLNSAQMMVQNLQLNRIRNFLKNMNLFSSSANIYPETEAFII